MDIEQRKQEGRDPRGLILFEHLRRDVGYALRSLRKSPGFSSIAILSLAIGIGANTTIFTFVNAVLLRPLPYPASDRLMILREQPLGSEGTVNVHPANFLEWQSRSTSFEAMALTQTPPLNVFGVDGAEQIGRVQTTRDLFRVFGVGPALGREFTDDETRPGRHDVVILGYGFWQRWFGGDPLIVGRGLATPEGSLTIVGVAPPGLRIGLMEPDAYTPLAIDPANPSAIGARSFECFGRVKPGVPLEAARAEMSAIASTLARERWYDRDMTVFVSRLHDYLVREGRPALRLLMGVVAAVLVIACANLAGLLIARGFARRAEFAMRSSLGASRGRLVQQLVIESLALAACGGAAGLVLAQWATRALVALTAGALTVGTAEPISIDSASLVFTLAVTTMTALVFGLAPAWQLSRVEPRAALQGRSRTMTSDRLHHHARSALVVAQVALAIVLMVGAGLLLRTFSSLVRVNLGFQTAQTITMRLFLGVRPPEARIAAIDQILDRVEALPGVKAASTIQFLPLSGMACGTGFWREGEAVGDPARALSTACALVSRGFFSVMGIPVLQGRPFNGQDRLGSNRVLVVNDTFAKRYYPGRSALGHRIQVQASNQTMAEIVGVVGDIRHNGLTSEPAPTVFLLHAQTPGYITNLVVRTAGDPSAESAAIRRAIHDVDPTQAVSAVRKMDEYVGEAMARPRLYAVLVTCFATIAVILAALGVYGLIAYLVAQRGHDIGIRLALGATSTNVFFEFVAHGGRLVASGIGLGIAAAVALASLASRLLYGVRPNDPVTYVAAAGAFLAVAVAAVTIPAFRASRIDPIRALRDE